MIRSVGQTDRILKDIDTSEWINKSDVGFGTSMKGMDVEDLGRVNDKFTLSDAPTVGAEKGQVQQTFGEILGMSVAHVNKLQQEANVAIEKLASGKSKNLHETMIAVERADIAFKKMNQIRMKVLDAYKEIMRMQV